MSKVEITGPRGQLLPVLETIQKSEVLQIDPDIRHRIDLGSDPVSQVRPLALDGKTLAERLFLEDLNLKVERLLALLPKVDTRESYLSPSRAVSSIASVVGKHLDAAEERRRRRESLQGELAQVNRYLMFLTTVDSLAPKGAASAGLDFIGVEVRDPAALEQLTRVAGRVLLGAEVRTAQAKDGSYIGLLTTEKDLATKLKEGLRENHIPEIALPAYLEGLALPEKLTALQQKRDALSAGLDSLDREEGEFATAWRGHYLSMRSWLQRRLALLRTSASVYETDRCFVIYGWMPSAGLDDLRRTLADRHGDTVVVEEREMLKKDLDDVPVAFRNPPYFRPFELLVRLLPTPRYTSIDPTPFIGIFFPLFFGMILGDVGYGVLLTIAAAVLIAMGRKRPALRPIGQILLAASIYTVIFGALYGECFGDLGVRLLGIHPFIDRRTSIIPMFYFALAVGGVHVLLGLVLGVIAAIRGRHPKEAVFRGISILMLLLVAGLLASYMAPVAGLLRKPMLVAILIAAPVVLLTGGVLAPFELLRTLGNIVSYARIMAVGLASVLLAYVANSLAGAAGSLWVGIAVAVLLHAFNIVLGVFAPTVHALRLHYVEFFSKFIETGGRRYQPLRKAD
ncbi:MAG TPA: V-type ATPase 116kDa subunit family protein [Steroidobacteraceae bacterium]|nr:V-type ATPase 116kDa subunit family protein [Steroidobacteraceae bacterium]